MLIEELVLVPRETHRRAGAVQHEVLQDGPVDAVEGLRKFLLAHHLVAVLIDAVFVRMVIGPALLRLAGRWNWWPGGLSERSAP